MRGPGGSLNLHVHFHLLVLDGVFARDAQGQLAFHPAAPPTAAELDAIVARAARLAIGWLRRRGYLDDSPLEARSNELPAQTALDACAAIAMGRGDVATMPRDATQDDDGHTEAEERPDKPVLAIDRDGFNLHAGVRIEAGDDVGRERICRYGARPPLPLERLRRLRGGRIAYRLKYVSRGRRGKHRVMTGVEFMARLAAIIAPPRYPLVRFAGVLAPRSAWRGEVVPKPRERSDTRQSCEDEAVRADRAQAGPTKSSAAPSERRGHPSSRGQRAAATHAAPVVHASDVALSAVLPRSTPPPTADVIRLAPNIISVNHWDRVLGGLLYAATPRVDWARLLRRSFDVDVLACARCCGRMRVLREVTDTALVRLVLESLGLPTDTPRVARARDPTVSPADETGG